MSSDRTQSAIFALVASIAGIAAVYSVNRLAEYGAVDSLLVISCGVVVVGVLMALRNRVSSPPVLITLVWIVSIAIGRLELWRVPSTQDAPWSAHTWFAFIVPWISFVSGCIWVTRGRSFALQSEAARVHLHNALVSKQLRSWAKRLFLVGFLAFAFLCFAFQRRTGVLVPILHPRAAEIRGQFLLPGGSIFYTLLSPAVVLATLYVLVSGGAKKHPGLVLTSLLAVVALLATGERAAVTDTLMMSGLVAAVVLGVTPRRAVLLAAVPLIVFAIVAEIRHRTFSQIETQPTSVTLFSNPTLANLYVYAGSEHNNFQVLVEDAPPRMNGRRMARAFLTWANRPQLAAYRQPLGWDIGNTVTWAGDFYLDFGNVGLMVVPFALGLISGLIYKGVCTKPTLLSVGCYAAIGNAIIYSPVTERFFQPVTVLFIAVIVTIHFLTRRTARRRQRSVPSSSLVAASVTSTVAP